MTILELALAAYGVYDTVGTAASIISGVDFTLRLSSKSTAEDLFKKSGGSAKCCGPRRTHRDK